MTDLPGLEFEHNEEIAMLRHKLRHFVAREITPRAADIDRSGQFPAEMWRKLGDLGVLGITVEQAYGGAALGYLAHIVAMEELSRGSASAGLAYCAHSNLCVNQIRRNGTSQQKLKYLPRLLAGDYIGALALAEAHAGSDIAGMTTRADKKGERWVLNGTKRWVTNGADADVLVVYAKTDLQAGMEGITAFLVDKRSSDFRVTQTLDKLGMHGSQTAELVFEDCEVPEENVLGTLGQGFHVLMSGLDFERIVLAGGPLGIMHACMDVVLPYVHERKQFGQAIGEFQLVQARLADMYTNMMACKAYVYAVGQACDRAQTAGAVRALRKDAAGAILYTAQRASWMAGETITALGGNGYLNDYPAGRLWRDAKLYEIGAGTSDMYRMLIGREIFSGTA